MAKTKLRGRGRPPKTNPSTEIQFVIEKGVPLGPNLRYSPMAEALKRTIQQLKPTESFIYPDKHRATAGSIISKLHKVKNGSAFRTAKINSESRRIWRIK